MDRATALRKLRARMRGFIDGTSAKVNPGVEGAVTRQLEHQS